MTHFDPAKIASVLCHHLIVLMESIVLDGRVAAPDAIRWKYERSKEGIASHSREHAIG